ncbi:flagellar basal body-associated protein FliL [Undibacterium sp.]|uniref:flagellar basal body-associated FliL family protein n=1 Tax=Undibacterium sp. TaxID=1914977 RepID=UPI00374DF8C6
MAKKAETENLTTYVVILAALGVAGILAGIWFYKASRPQTAAPPSYLDLSLPTVHIPGYGVRADVAVAADGEDADWLKQQREPLGSLFQKTLVAADPEEIRTTKGLLDLQASMTKVANSSLRSDKVRGVYLTNFLMQSE